MTDFNKLDKIAQSYCNNFLSQIGSQEEEIIYNLAVGAKPTKVDGHCNLLEVFGFIRIPLNSNAKEVELTGLGYRLARIIADNK